ncbi:MAG: 30S ribosomal protein S9 [Patescibacteria group bacterium]
MTAEKTQYIEAVGRRKTAIARVRITPAAKQSIRVNDKEMAEYFKTAELQRMALESMEKSGVAQKFSISAKLIGGGISSQAEAVRLGVARCLEKFDGTLRTILKKEGFLTRDQRAVERKKPGLKKARKRPTWSKR